MNYATATGQSLEFARHDIGRGGEGVVLPIAGNPARVAKVFHHPTLEQRAKLEFMVANPVPQAADHFWVAWPIDVVITRDPQPQFAGYVMPRLTDAQPLFTCYNPGIRLKKCPGFDYRHLVHCGRNLAAAFNQAHAKQHVIGDPNESNAFVRSDARVTLIDADSWQISDPIVGRTFHSSVAKPDFLPPELQNRSLKGFDRKPWHDNFGLAVLLFKLTNEGNHPFDGVYHGAGDVPALEARIKAGAFPYLDRSGHWSPKGLALQFDMLHPRLRELFVRAFQIGHARPQSRPSARDWQEAFTLAEGDLQGCLQNSHHWFWGNQCIWCQRKALLGGQDPFPGGPPRAARSVTPGVPPVPVSQTDAKTIVNSINDGYDKFLKRNFPRHPTLVGVVLIITLDIVLGLVIVTAFKNLMALLNK